MHGFQMIIKARSCLETLSTLVTVMTISSGDMDFLMAIEFPFQIKHFVTLVTLERLVIVMINSYMRQ